MAPPTYTLKQGDDAPPLKVILRGTDGAPVSLTGAQVTFVMCNAAVHTDLRIDYVACEITDVAGKVQYNWRLGDTAIAGKYYGEFRCLFMDGSTLTFPNKEHILINIIPQAA